jgi:YvbH-like oligomerisation region./Protein of unknown function (DUF1696).
MFGKIASDALGLSDRCKVIKPADYDSCASDDYLLHEDGEKIYFLLKSRSDEYCFTNYALIHLDGKNAVSKKRMLRRYNFSAYDISQVFLETAGTLDLDVEIKFRLGGMDFSIDIAKENLPELKQLYKVLVSMADLMAKNKDLMDFAERAVQIASASVGANHSQNANLADQFERITAYSFLWLKESKSDYTSKKDYTDIFQKFIQS